MEKKLKFRKFMNFLNSWKEVLSFIVVLISIITFVITKSGELSISKTTKIKASFMFSNDSIPYLLINNIGKRPGLLKNIIVNVGEYPIEFDWQKIENSENKQIIPGLTNSLYALNRNVIKRNELHISIPPDELESYGDYIYSWKEYFPGLDKRDEWEQPWCELLLYRMQRLFEEIDFEELDDFVLDWDEKNPHKRIADYIGQLDNNRDSTNYHENKEILDKWIEINYILNIVEKCFNDSITMTIILSKSNGKEEKLEIPIEYSTIKEFIMPFFLTENEFERTNYFSH
jgi:hypothetical protein